MTDTPETTPPAAPSQKVRYELSDRGVITRLDPKEPNAKPVGIAVLHTDGESRVVRWSHADFQRFHAPVRGLLNQLGIAAEFEPYETRPPVMREAVCVETGQEPETAAVRPETAAPSDPDGPDGMRGLSVEQRKAVNHLRAKEGFPLGELERPAPPPPRLTSGAGDKTPAYTTWLLRYHPTRFVETYGVERMGQKEETIPSQVDPVTHKKKPARRVWRDGFVLARRKTIYTELLTNRPPEKED